MRALVLLWIKPANHILKRDGNSGQGAARGIGWLECGQEGAIFMTTTI